MYTANQNINNDKPYKPKEKLISQINSEDNTMNKIGGIKLRKKNNNIWELRLTIDGEKKSLYGKTQSIVKQKYDTLMKSIKKQKIKTRATTFNDWLEQYLEIYKNGKIGDNSYKQLKSMLTRYIADEIGNKPINKITRIELQKLFNSFDHLGNTKSKLKFYVQDIFNKAYKNNLIKENVAEDIIVNKSITKSSTALTPEEQQKLINYQSENPIYNIFFLYCLFTGCRRAEALSLKLSDIKNNTIHIRGTKTAKSDRYIPYFNNIKDILKATTNENVFEEVTVTKSLREFKLILPNHTIRDLRKTFATNCYEKGISPKVIQKWLGHTTIAMTMNTYTDIRNVFELEEIDKMNKISTPFSTPILKENNKTNTI